MLFAASTLLAALAISPAAVNAIPHRRDGQPKPMVAPSNIPSVWQKAATQPQGTDPITFTLVLNSEKDPKELETKMTEISKNPDLHWLTQEELREYVKASDDAKSAVEDAIKGIDGASFKYSALHDKITVSTTVDQASKFFDASFDHYTYHGPVTSNAIKTTAYTIPGSISSVVRDVFPIASFSTVRGLKSKFSETIIQARQDNSTELAASATPSSCNTKLVTSPCVRSLYGFDSYTPVGEQQGVGIMGFIDQSYSPTDLATYLKAYRPDASGYSIAVNTSDGATNNPSNPGTEAALDTQTVAGIIYPLPSTFWDVGTQETQGDIFLISFQEFLDAGSFPAVTSYSYGSTEEGLTSEQANTMCDAAKQLSAMGMTIVASSGDSGINGQGQDTTCEKFTPTYPSGCPYILSVGATQSFSPEVMVDKSLAGFFSGAGFSNLFPTPDYQVDAVNAYLAGAGSSETANFNTKGRAFPDISAQGSRQAVVVKGRTVAVGGTSASAPIVSSGLALLNDLLLAAGKSTAGWIHPMIYSSSGAFTDITSGGSFGCSDPSFGLSAGPAWDASAGLGTPIFSGLRALYGV